EPWEMPGYSDKVIMAAGAFTQGSSIELSADGPLRPPYTAYFQGGLTYESGKIGIMSAAQAMLDLK
ncbi:MAG: methionine gamma-lyase family protein, partial [Clostridia bacterium]|nr:methionine gamma-lyase family protein [Clostridia bacterium]